MTVGLYKLGHSPHVPQLRDPNTDRCAKPVRMQFSRALLLVIAQHRRKELLCSFIGRIRKDSLWVGGFDNATAIEHHDPM